MSDLVVMKSYHNGISLHLDAEAQFSDILQEMADKFQNSRKFFKDAKVALAIDGRVLSAEEERQIIRTISMNSDVSVLCLVSKDEAGENEFIRAIRQTEIEADEVNGRFHRGNLTDGEVLESDGSILIIGDVEEGACIVAAKDVVVIGALNGEVHAGTDGEENHFVFALKMNPSKCKISSYRYKSGKKGLFGKKDKVNPQILYIKNKEIIIEAITKELPDIIHMY